MTIYLDIVLIENIIINSIIIYATSIILKIKIKKIKIVISSLIRSNIFNIKFYIKIPNICKYYNENNTINNNDIHFI